jgi:translation elongation factor P/translation initiation factor 5A
MLKIIDKQQVQTTSQPSTVNIDKEKINKLKTNLEKISFKQNRNYEEEAIKQQQSKDQQPKIVDKQIVSFNFNKANEFPNLYKGNLYKYID